MEPAGLPTEIVILGWSVVLLIVQLALQASAAVAETGTRHALGPRDEQRPPTGLVANRLARALHNLLETYPAFVALALALAITGQTGGLGVIGAQMWIWARVAYVPLYAFGVPMLRTLAWVIALVGLVLMLIELLS